MERSDLMGEANFELKTYRLSCRCCSVSYEVLSAVLTEYHCPLCECGEPMGVEEIE